MLMKKTAIKKEINNQYILCMFLFIKKIMFFVLKIFVFFIKIFNLILVLILVKNLTHFF